MNKLIRQSSLIKFFLSKYINILKIKNIQGWRTKEFNIQGFIKRKHAPLLRNKRPGQQKL
jgi:hypothetical protein